MTDSQKNDITRSRIYRAIRKATSPGECYTFRELAKRAKISPDNAWKRLAELGKDNKWIRDGRKRCPVTGRSVTVWKRVI